MRSVFGEDTSIVNLITNEIIKTKNMHLILRFQIKLSKYIEMQTGETMKKKQETQSNDKRNQEMAQFLQCLFNLYFYPIILCIVIFLYCKLMMVFEVK